MTSLTIYNVHAYQHEVVGLFFTIYLDICQAFSTFGIIEHLLSNSSKDMFTKLATSSHIL